MGAGGSRARSGRGRTAVGAGGAAFAATFAAPGGGAGRHASSAASATEKPTVQAKIAS